MSKVERRNLVQTRFRYRRTCRSKRRPRASARGSGDAAFIHYSRATATAEELVEKGDVEGLWLLGAGLLNQGPEGFERFDELFGWFFEQMNSNRPLRDMLSDEELVLGRFFRVLADNDGAVLRYGLYLLDSDPEGLPPPLRDFRGELTDEVGAMLLGYYRGDDPEIYSGYLSHFRANVEAGDRVDEELIFAIGNIPTEESTDLLIEMLEGGTIPSNRQKDVVSALAWRKNPRALAALERYRETVNDDRSRSMIDQAIRLLSP